MKVLITVDGSEPALDAVRHALSLRREGQQAGFVLATVQESTCVCEMKGAAALFNAAECPFEREIG